MFDKGNVTKLDIVHTLETDEKRLAKVEAQTRALAKAVIAMVEPADSIAPAIEVVKAHMGTGDDPVASSVDGPHVSRWNECPLCGSLLTDPVHRSADGHGYKDFICSHCQHRWAPKEV